MKPRTKRMLSFMNIISWVIFIGLCIKTGAIIYSFFVSLAINPVATKNLHMGLNLSELYKFSSGHYGTVVTLIIVLSAAKAYLFFLVIKIFLKINFVHPFSSDVSTLIARIGYVALGIGVVTLVANNYSDWLSGKGVVLPRLEAYLGGAAEFLLLGGIIFIIAQVVNRGIEIQSENELTV